jgi:hypothetical protein
MNVSAILFFISGSSVMLGIATDSPILILLSCLYLIVGFATFFEEMQEAYTY